MIFKNDLSQFCDVLVAFVSSYFLLKKYLQLLVLGVKNNLNMLNHLYSIGMIFYQLACCYITY